MREAVDFDAFFVAEYPPLLRLAWALTGRRDVAEEHVQEGSSARIGIGNV